MMRPEKSIPDSIVTFKRVFSAALPPMRADKSALGTLPAAAFQYCEPARLASQYGWYIFPPADIRLYWDGVETYVAEDNEWRPFSRMHLDNDFLESWDAHAPEDLKGCSPPFLTNLFVPGLVQIWSGLLISTSPDWSVSVGPLANVPQSRHYCCFEGIIETDSFRPCPLFINIKLLVTDREIFLPKNRPIFQVKPVRRECYSSKALEYREFVGLDPLNESGGSMSEEDWQGYRSTVRKDDEIQDHTPGSYGAKRRQRAKREAN